ncbi:MAG: DNA recombination protein RecF [Ignavibacteria bacterium RBG_13_36_8]|nr:MAG: DNA recombination protein RecF [Ignavibacteria bacterium RBG_13_36_8]
MILKHIDLINFRLHRNSNILFSDKLNYIVGGNGQGKTTVLEAIYYLCTTKSLNLSLDIEAVTFGENFFEINGDFADKTSNKVKLRYQLENNKKLITIDDKQIYRASSVIGKFPVVTLIQADHNITLGAPAERRKFVDSVISQASGTYLKILIDYNKTLRQRSSLLSQIKETNSKKLYEQLDAWNETLVTLGTEVIKHRLEFIHRFKEYLTVAYNRIMEGKEAPTVSYEYLNGSNGVNVERVFFEMLTQYREDELRRGVNLVGPHRDDFKFYINDLELRKYGSQGQHKTFQIALRYGEFFYLKDSLGKTPIFIMDDVFGELDANRVKKISAHLIELGQVFITLTDHSNFEHIMKSDEDLLIEIEDGKVAYA